MSDNALFAVIVVAIMFYLCFSDYFDYKKKQVESKKKDEGEEDEL